MAATRPLHFVWLDPGQPLGDNDLKHMPPQYARNVEDWRARVGPRNVRVSNGAACAEAVAVAESSGRVDGLWKQYVAFAHRYGLVIRGPPVP